MVQQTLRSQLTHPASAQFGSVPHNSVELRSVRCSQHSATCSIQMATSIKSFVCAHLHILCFRYIFLLQYNFLYSTSAPNLMHDSHALCHSFSFVHKYYSHTYIHIYSHINPMYTLEIMCMQLSICIYTYVCACMCVCVWAYLRQRVIARFHFCHQLCSAMACPRSRIAHKIVRVALVGFYLLLQRFCCEHKALVWGQMLIDYN